MIQVGKLERVDQGIDPDDETHPIPRKEVAQRIVVDYGLLIWEVQAILAAEGTPSCGMEALKRRLWEIVAAHKGGIGKEPVPQGASATIADKPAPMRRRKAPARPPTVTSPKGNAKADPDGATFKGTLPTKVARDGEVIAEVKTWRGVFLLLVEEATRTGHPTAIPEDWIRGEEHRTVSRLSDGRFLYTNLDSDDIVDRAKRVARSLGTTLTVDFHRGKDGPEETTSIP